MSNLHGLHKVCTLWIKTFVLFWLENYYMRRSFPFLHKLSYLLTYFSYVYQNTPGSKNSCFTTRTGFEQRRSTRRDRHTITIRLFSFMCHVHIPSFVTDFTNLLSWHRNCNIYDHIVMTCDFIIKKVNSFFRFEPVHQTLYLYFLS